MNYLDFVLGDTMTARAVSALLFVIAGYLAGKLLRLLLLVVKNRLAKKSRTALDDELLTVLARLATGMAVLLALMFALRGLTEGIAGEPPFVQKLVAGLSAASYVSVILYAAFVISRVIDTLVMWYMRDVAARTETRLDEELAPLINRVLNIIVYAVGVIIVLDHFDQNISTLVVSLGVGSLAIALAAQETLANMIAGFVLMIDRPFRISDRIRLPDGTIGIVTEIGIRSTKVIDDNLVTIITPNAEIVKSQIKNFSYPNDTVRFQVPFSVAYGTDIDRMRRLVVERINAEPDVVDRHTTEIRMKQLAESSIACEAMVFMKNPNVIPRRKSDLTYLIYRVLTEHGIKIPFPQRVLHLTSSASRSLGSAAPAESAPPAGNAPPDRTPEP